MPAPVIVVHYHELWLKGRNRDFFLGKFMLALRRTLSDFPVQRFGQPGDRVLVYLAEDAPRLIQGGARLSMIGRRDRLPADLAAAVGEIEAATASGNRLNLRIALDYSSREAIALAAARLGPAGSLEDLDRLIAGDPGIGPVDLLIRTGGEQRLSDFMLWECAFAELWFTRRMWPEFDGADLSQAIGDFRRRTRTFGAVVDDAPALRRVAG